MFALIIKNIRRFFFKHKYIWAIGFILIIFLIFLFLVMNAPSMEDPFNLGGRRIYKNYYLYKFPEGKEPDNYYLWRKYDELPGIPFSQNISSIVQKNEYQLYLCIDHEWYFIDMRVDNIKKIDSLPQEFYYNVQFPEYFWMNL